MHDLLLQAISDSRWYMDKVLDSLYSRLDLIYSTIIVDIGRDPAFSSSFFTIFPGGRQLINIDSECCRFWLVRRSFRDGFFRICVIGQLWAWFLHACWCSWFVDDRWDFRVVALRGLCVGPSICSHIFRWSGAACTASVWHLSLLGRRLLNRLIEVTSNGFYRDPKVCGHSLLLSLIIWRVDSWELEMPQAWHLEIICVYLRLTVWSLAVY